MKRKIYLIICILLSAAVLVSCGNNGGLHGGGVTGSDERGETVYPAEYTVGDVSYSVTLSDGRREVTLEVQRVGGINTARVTFPEELSRTVIVDDVDGVRMQTGEEEMEFILSPEASAGISALLQIASTELNESERVDDNSYSLCIQGVDVDLTLDSEGYPLSAVLTWNASAREARYTFKKASE